MGQLPDSLEGEEGLGRVHKGIFFFHNRSSCQPNLSPDWATSPLLSLWGYSFVLPVQGAQVSLWTLPFPQQPQFPITV